MNFKDEIQDLIEKSGMGLTGGFNGKTKVSMDDLDTDIQDLITKSKVVELRLPDAFKNARQYIAAPNPIFFKVLDDLLVGNNVYLVGEAGTGKTYLAEKAAQALKREYTTINCNQWTSPREIIGGETISGAKDGKLIEAWRDGKILILDELPKLDPNTAGMINEALAKSDKTGVDSEITTFDGKKIRKHPNFACIATGNTTGKTVSPRYNDTPPSVSVPAPDVAKQSKLKRQNSKSIGKKETPPPSALVGEELDIEIDDTRYLTDKKAKVKQKQKGDTLTWEKPVANDQLQYAELGMLTCDMKFITATSKVGVVVPIEAEEGDIIVLDAKSNRPMLVIKKQYAKRKCLTLKEGETAHVVIEKPDESVKQVVLTDAGRKELPIAHTEDILDEKVTEADVEIVKATHQSDCSIAEYNHDMPNVPVRTWLEDMVERFNSNKTNLYVTKVLISKEGEVFARVANKSVLGWMIAQEWYQICPDSGKITELVAPPKRGSYEVEVSEKEIKEFYSDSEDYSKCSHWMSQIYKIRMGEVDGDKKALYKKWSESCRNSNLVQRYKKLHGYIHKKARKIREEKPNKYDTHYEAVRAVRAMLKKAEMTIKD